jgi:hypothetical protein
MEPRAGELDPDRSDPIRTAPGSKRIKEGDAMKERNTMMGLIAAVSTMGLLASGCAARQSGGDSGDGRQSQYDTTGTLDTSGTGLGDGGTYGGSDTASDSVRLNPYPGMGYPGGTGGAGGTGTGGTDIIPEIDSVDPGGDPTVDSLDVPDWNSN